LDLAELRSNQGGPGDRPFAGGPNLYCNLHYNRLCRKSHKEEPMSRAVRKDHPLSMRLPASDIAMIDRAATLRGRSRTDFVRDAAVRAAEEAIMDSAPIRMSPAGFKAFLAAIAGPSKPVPEMVALFKRKAVWESGS
jgi:uncharacterized protein (DUF1778 family)